MNLVSKETFSQILSWHPEDILKFMLNYSQFSRLNPDSVALVEFKSIPKKCPSRTFVKDFGWLFMGDGECRKRHLTSDDEYLQLMIENYPILEHLKFENYVLAGSCPLLHCTQYLHLRDITEHVNVPGDLDFYLVADTEEEGFEVYCKLLEEISTYLKEINCLTSRNKNCTTITWNDEIPQTLQIIHRIFKTKQATVVGFDQTPCKVFYNKENGIPNIYYTLDAALALFFGINPIDWRRESQNHAMRYIKYLNYGFVPIFPGLPFPAKNNLDDYENYKLPGITLNFVVFRTRQRVRNKNYVREKALHQLHFKDSDKQESDYGDHKEININRFYYHSLSMLVKEKLEAVSLVIENVPSFIVNQWNELNIKDLLLKLHNEEKLKFYFGEYDGWHLNCYYEEKQRISQFKILTDSQLEELASLNFKIKTLIEKRTQILKERYDLVLQNLVQVKFNSSNPGTQYTASFNPILRKGPKAYWGEKCIFFEYDLNFKSKFTFYLIWKFADLSYLKCLNRDVIFFIFKWLDIIFFEEILSGKNNEFSLESQKRYVSWFQIRKIEQDEKSEFRFPWESISSMKYSMEIYKNRVISDN